MGGMAVLATGSRGSLSRRLPGEPRGRTARRFLVTRAKDSRIRRVGCHKDVKVSTGKRLAKLRDLGILPESGSTGRFAIPDFHEKRSEMRTRGARSSTERALKGRDKAGRVPRIGIDAWHPRFHFGLSRPFRAFSNFYRQPGAALRCAPGCLVSAFQAPGARRAPTVEAPEMAKLQHSHH